MAKPIIKLEDAVLDFGDIHYSREMEERALFPYPLLNKLTGGIVQGTITVIVADAGAGKTTMISDCINKIISDGDKVFAMFGEGTIKDQQDKMYRQMTVYDKNTYLYVPYKKNGKNTNIGGYFVSEESEKYVKEKTRGKLFLYDIRYGMTITNIVQAIDYAIEKYGVKYFILDNASQIETVSNAETKELKDAFEILRQVAIDRKIGVVVLAHYRKQNDVSKFRRDMTEIMGTSALSQKGATVLTLYRMDYLDRSTQYFKSFEHLMEENGWLLAEKNKHGDYKISCVVEVLKSRNGNLGFCALAFNPLSQTYYQIDKAGTETDKAVLHSEKPPEKKQGFLSDLSEVKDEELPF